METKLKTKIIPRSTSEALKFLRQVRFLPDFDPDRARVCPVPRKVTELLHEKKIPVEYSQKKNPKMSQTDEVCLKQPHCCEIFDRFCFGCRDIAIMKAHQAYRERLRQLMVVPAPGVDQKESTGWKRHSGVSMEVVDLVSDTDDY